MAYKEIIEPKRAVSAWPTNRGLVLLGYIAFLDPPKETAAQAIAALHQHGVDGESAHRRQRRGHAQDLLARSAWRWRTSCSGKDVEAHGR